VQAVVASISEGAAGYAAEVAKTLQKQGVRAQSDLRADKIGYKIREHSLQKVPYILVAGDKEQANGTIAVRARGNQDLGTMPVHELMTKLQADISAKR
jgi:threonyl-tRNA synthetase